MWAAAGVRPVRVVSGSHFRTVVFGAVSIDGTQLFRQYDVFDGASFLDFLKKVHRKFGMLYLFMDKARQHRRTRIVTDYLRENRKTLRVRWIPTASPEFNAVEECWRQGRRTSRLCRSSRCRWTSSGGSSRDTTGRGGSTSTCEASS